LLTVVAAVVVGGAGLWAFVAPRSFFEVIAVYPPYNQHFIHDLGAFQLGLAAALVLGLFLRDALLAVLGGNAVGAVVHFVSHVEDRALGGHASDPFTVGAVALLLLVASGLRWRQLRGPA
jgi:hypothetical protein